MPSWAGVTSSQPGSAATTRSACWARTTPCSIALEGVDPVDLERQPQLQRAELARERDPAVGEVDLVVAGRGVAQIRRARREGGGQQRSVAHEHAAQLGRLEEPLVRVERERVGALEAGQLPSPPLAQRRGRPVGAVDVQPHALGVARAAQRDERVDRARAGRARGGDDALEATGSSRRPSIRAASASTTRYPRWRKVSLSRLSSASVTQRGYR
jgi:hypothetical protein